MRPGKVDGSSWSTGTNEDQRVACPVNALTGKKYSVNKPSRTGVCPGSLLRRPHYAGPFDGAPGLERFPLFPWEILGLRARGLPGNARSEAPGVGNFPIFSGPENRSGQQNCPRFVEGGSQCRIA